MSSTYDNNGARYGVGNCHDGKTDDDKFCHSAKEDKVNPNPKHRTPGWFSGTLTPNLN